MAEHTRAEGPAQGNAETDTQFTRAESLHHNANAIEFFAEWALKGKGPEDREYRMLDCSTSVVTRENFIKVLERYSPGSLKQLPEVTVSWFTSGATGDYIALSVHRQPNPPKVDAAKRPFYETNLFCLDYAELARERISYASMYEEFNRCRLPPEDSGRPIAPDRRIAVRLATGQAIARPYLQARAAAAWLLTDTDVCILGADGTSVEDRLRFIDQVVSVLPYGLRSRLSASTWAVSTYRSHKIRLFFSDTPRNNKDHLIHLSGSSELPPAKGNAPKINWYISEYMRWLDADPQACMEYLASMTAPRGFTEDDVMSVMADLELAQRRGPAAEQSPGAIVQRQKQPTIEDWLDRLGERLNVTKNPDILSIVETLSHFADSSQIAEPYRSSYQRKIRDYNLLRQDLPLGPGLRRDLYSALLRLAFRPIDYDSYLQVSQCIGEGVRSIHTPLAETMLQLEPTEPRVQYLLLKDKGGSAPSDYFKDLRLPPEQLILFLLKLDDKTQPPHRAKIYGIVLDELERQAQPGRDKVREAIASFSYLTVPIEAQFGTAHEQVSLLSQVLSIAFGNEPPEDAGHQILGKCLTSTTPALIIAVLEMKTEQDASQLAWDLLYNYTVPAFTESKQQAIAELLVKRKPAEVGKQITRPKKRWWRGRGRREKPDDSKPIEPGDIKLLVISLTALVIVIFGFASYVIFVKN